LLTGLLLILRFAAAEPSGLPPSLTEDLDGDGSAETLTALPARGAVRLQVRDANGRTLAEAEAPAPIGEVVPIKLTSAPIGSAGALVEVAAGTDRSECHSVWRYRDASLARLPVRDGAGNPLPDCEAPGRWAYRWESAGEGRPSAWVRERIERVARGSLVTRETFSFAGFSLDLDVKRTASEIEGVPIPSWYNATLYPRPALETLYGRFRLAALKDEPTLRIEADRPRGVFALRFQGPGGEKTVAPVDSYSTTSGEVSLSARAGGKTAHVSIRLSADGTVPYEVRVTGLGPPLDQVYGPAGSWRGGARKVFPTAADELASENLAGVWGDSRGKNTTITVEGEPPYRVRMGPSTFTIDLQHVTSPTDLLLLPTGDGDRPWGLVLRGPNAMDRIPFTCAGQATARTCRPDGEAETLRRIGARVNVR
jgi:hypothetical protein